MPHAFALQREPADTRGAVGTPYNYVFTPKNGAPPYAFWFDSGELPPGLKIESDGTIHGTPTEPGKWVFTSGRPSTAARTPVGTSVKIRESSRSRPALCPVRCPRTPYTATISITGNGGLGMGWKVAAGALRRG